MRKILITGGAGFIGVNAAARFDAAGWEVIAFDNLSRRGAAQNREWLTSSRPRLKFLVGDIRDRAGMRELLRTARPDVVLHLAAQVAVTTSVNDPAEDFEINAHGTFNVLEAVRREAPQAFFIYASTNKVYGKMEHVGTVERQGRYAYDNLPQGCSEEQPLDFHSPYGCSKGAADQYTLDYARIYGLTTVSFRQSCIYGPRQMGVEDQGWVAWFSIAATLGKPITIYGDGKQVRDVLHVDDLVACYAKAIDHQDKIAGRAFNIGGGPANTLSLLELVAMLERRTGRRIAPAFADWRPGDQPVFVCDVSAAQRAFGWSPTIGPAEGVGQLLDWVKQNAALFQ